MLLNCVEITFAVDDYIKKKHILWVIHILIVKNSTEMYGYLFDSTVQCRGKEDVYDLWNF